MSQNPYQPSSSEQQDFARSAAATRVSRIPLQSRNPFRTLITNVDNAPPPPAPKPQPDALSTAARTEEPSRTQREPPSIRIHAASDADDPSTVSHSHRASIDRDRRRERTRRNHAHAEPPSTEEYESELPGPKRGDLQEHPPSRQIQPRSTRGVDGMTAAPVAQTQHPAVIDIGGKASAPRVERLVEDSTDRVTREEQIFESPVRTGDEDRMRQIIDDAQDAGMPGLQFEGNGTLPPALERYIEQAAQQYLSRHPAFASNISLPSTSTSPRESDRTFRQPQEEQEEEDDGFCCSNAKGTPEGIVTEVFHCYACKITFCGEHWDRETSHRRKRPGHEKIDADVAKTIEDTLEIRIDEKEQARLHVMDECASWFGAIHDDDGVVFRDLGRYSSLMAELSLAERKRAYPALVSFVGDTGAGKSSLIKLLVGTKTSKTTKSEKPSSQSRQTPVIGNNGATTPTSGDVHLYADPETFYTQRPILYADCEGLRGGTLEPVGARWRRKMYSNTRNRNRTASFDRHVRRKHESAEREILWATTPEKSTRKYFVEHLYPRLLYTFSDAIVFVVRNARMIEEVIEQLVVWADAVIESASNQPVLPHAIIVLNASDNQDPQLWSVDFSTNVLMDALSQAVEQNPRLRSFAAKWTSRGFQISSIQHLLLAYYSSVRVLRIPEKKHPSLIHDQIRQLYREIDWAVTQSHEEKHKKRLKLDAEFLQPYLQRAFDHFCKDLNDPFDFIKASFADTGIPPDFSGNTLKLAVEIMQHWSDRIDGEMLFKELSFLIASCVMLECVRNSKLGEASAIFQQYIDHFDETLDDFCDKVWPCEYVTTKGRCRNVRFGHAKGHQFGRGELEAGQYHATFTAESFRHKFRHYIFSNLVQLLDQLSTSANEHETAARLHQETILKPFYAHIGGAHHYVSHSTCFCCLVSPAEHCLPCGHVLCTPCIRDFGLRRSQHIIEMRSCPLHKSPDTNWSKLVSVKPEHAGTRVLSLDGGGVRGLLILMTLQAVQADLGEIPIQYFFDLVIGTSTGGIIALGMAQMGWSLTDCLQKFIDLAAGAFQKHKTWEIEWFESLVTNMQGGRYKIAPLEGVLAGQFQDHNLFGGVRHETLRDIPRCKVAVTTTSMGGTPFVLANYNRLEQGESSLYTFLRAEKPTKEIKIWQAARATSAAPRIFKPYDHIDSGHTFIDGGIYFNNPIEIALNEAVLLWPQAKPRLPDVLLSLGTGYSEKKRGVLSPIVTPPKNPLGRIAQNMKQQLKIATDHVKASLRSEEEYRRIRGHYPDSNQEVNNCFKRFNYYFESAFGKLTTDNVDMMPNLRNYAKQDLERRKDEIRDIANRLIATSFYFDVEQGSMQRDVGGSLALQGHIRCRFQQNSPELRMFGDLIFSRLQEAKSSSRNQHHSPCLVVEDKTRSLDSVQYVLHDSTIDMMQTYGQFSFDKIPLTVTSYHAESDIYLRFGDEDDDSDHNSISGFPRRWDDRAAKKTTLNLGLSEIRARQASRRGRSAWTKPASRPPNMLEKYANGRNPGMATDDEMSAVESRLTDPMQRLVVSELAGNDVPSWPADEKKVLPISASEQDQPSFPHGSPAPIARPPLYSNFPDGREGGAVELPANPPSPKLMPKKEAPPYPTTPPVSSVPTQGYQPYRPDVYESPDLYGRGSTSYTANNQTGPRITMLPVDEPVHLPQYAYQTSTDNTFRTASAVSAISIDRTGRAQTSSAVSAMSSDWYQPDRTRDDE